MRSITLLLSLFLTVFGGITAGAQSGCLNPGYITDATTIKNGGMYVFKNVGDATVRRGWMYESTTEDANKNKLRIDLDVTHSDWETGTVPDNYVFVAETADNGGFYFKNLSTDRYLTNNTSTVEAGSKGVVNVLVKSGATSGTFNLQVPGTYLNVNAGGWLALWNDVNDANGKWQVYEVNAADAVASVTITRECGEGSVVTKGFYPKGSTITAPTIEFCTATGTTTYTVTDDAEQSVTFTYQQNVPFAVSNSFAEAKWNMVNIHSNSGNYIWTYEAGATAVKALVQPTAQSAAPTDEQLWCFVGNPLSGYTIYNKAAGENMTLNTADNNAPAVMGEATSATKFHIVRSPAITNAACFQPVGQTNYLNRQGTAPESYLKRWSATDQGSSCLFFAPDYALLNYASAEVNIPENALGASTYFDDADNAAKFSEAYAAAQQTGYDHYDMEKVNALAEMAQAVETGGRHSTEITTGAYYRLVNAANLKYMVNTPVVDRSNTTYPLSGSATKDNARSEVGTVFQIEKNGESYSLKVQGLYVGAAPAGAPVRLVSSSDEKGAYSVSNNGARFYFDAGTSNGCLHYASGQAGGIVGWNTNAAATWWYIVPATDIEVALTAVGDASYATTYLPFAVSEVSGATAYTGAYNAANSTLDMTETTAIPANTGVVLKGTADATTAVLTIGEAAEATSGLTGTLTPITLADDTRANYLVLGTNEGAIGFYKPSASAASIPANKAYLANATQATQAVALNFGGTPTGITGIEAADSDSNAPVYDITGRRVNGTAKGGIYIQNGRKFIVK